MNTGGEPHGGRIKELVGEVLLGIKCTGGSKDNDLKEITGTLRYYRRLGHICVQ